MEFEKGVLQYLKTGHWSGDQMMNPIEVERGVTYVRHDGIRIGNSMDSSGGVSLQFTFRGAAVAWTRFEGATLNTIRHLSVNGVSGRHQVLPLR
jgi:hypothetical protein